MGGTLVEVVPTVIRGNQSTRIGFRVANPAASSCAGYLNPPHRAVACETNSPSDPWVW